MTIHKNREVIEFEGVEKGVWNIMFDMVNTIVEFSEDVDVIAAASAIKEGMEDLTDFLKNRD